MAISQLALVVTDSNTPHFSISMRNLQALQQRIDDTRAQEEVKATYHLANGMKPWECTVGTQCGDMGYIRTTKNHRQLFL